MNNIFFYVAAAGYTLSAICFLTAVILFFKFEILYVIKDLNGTIAQREISNLRKKTVSGKNNRIQIYDPDKFSQKLSGKTDKRFTGSIREENVENKERSGANDTEMQTSILQFNKVISKDFVIVTDIVFTNTNEVM